MDGRAHTRARNTPRTAKSISLCVYMYTWICTLTIQPLLTFLQRNFQLGNPMFMHQYRAQEHFVAVGTCLQNALSPPISSFNKAKDNHEPTHQPIRLLTAVLLWIAYEIPLAALCLCYTSLQVSTVPPWQHISTGNLFWDKELTRLEIWWMQVKILRHLKYLDHWVKCCRTNWNNVEVSFYNNPAWCPPLPPSTGRIVV